MDASLPDQIPGFRKWTNLCKKYARLARSADAHDKKTEHLDMLLSGLRQDIPLYPACHEIAEVARATGCQEVLELVYRSLTPGAHVLHLRNAGPVDDITFGALLAFREEHPSRKQTKDPDMVAILLRHVLARDSKALFARLPDLDEQEIFVAFRTHPDLLELCGPKLAPVFKHFLSGWARYSPTLLLSVFLRLADLGYAKTLNAILASGYNPLKYGNTAPGEHPIDPTALHTRQRYPAPLVEVLTHLNIQPRPSQHDMMKYPGIYAPGAAELILGSSPDSRFNGIARSDWARHTASPSGQA